MKRDPRGKWTIFIEKGGERKNKAIVTGRESLAKAIKAAEVIAPQLDPTIPGKPVNQSKSKAPRFQEYSEGWLEENAGRWDLQTCKRYLKESDPLDLNERDRFLACADKTCTWAEQLILKVMVHAGLRLGEVLAMRIRHLDLTRMLYHVSESFKQYRFSKPKRGKKRFVDITGFLTEELDRYITHLKRDSLRRGRGGDIDLLFPDSKESGYWPYSQRKFQGIMKRVCRAAKLRIRNPRDLRHSYAVILLMADKSPAYVKEQLGHSSISITVDFYGHWIPGRGREGLEAALLGSKEMPPENGSKGCTKNAYNRI